MKKLFLIVIFSLSVYVSVAPLLADNAQAAFLSGNTIQSLNSNSDQLGQAAGYDPNTSLARVVSIAIRGFLGLLGVIFIIIIIIAGFNWMTAGGDEEKIKKAVAHIRNAVIGLIIIVSAYAITYFVFSNLPGSGSGGPPPPIQQ